jgi:hypothetical protein
VAKEVRVFGDGQRPGGLSAGAGLRVGHGISVCAGACWWDWN